LLTKLIDIQGDNSFKAKLSPSSAYAIDIILITMIIINLGAITITKKLKSIVDTVTNNVIYVRSAKSRKCIIRIIPVGRNR